MVLTALMDQSSTSSVVIQITVLQIAFKSSLVNSATRLSTPLVSATPTKIIVKYVNQGSTAMIHNAASVPSVPRVTTAQVEARVPQQIHVLKAHTVQRVLGHHSRVHPVPMVTVPAQPQNRIATHARETRSII